MEAEAEPHDLEAMEEPQESQVIVEVEEFQETVEEAQSVEEELQEVVEETDEVVEEASEAVEDTNDGVVEVIREVMEELRQPQDGAEEPQGPQEGEELGVDLSEETLQELEEVIGVPVGVLQALSAQEEFGVVVQQMMRYVAEKAQYQSTLREFSEALDVQNQQLGKLVLIVMKARVVRFN